MASEKWKMAMLHPSRAMPFNLVSMHLHAFSNTAVSKDYLCCVSMNLFVTQTDDQVISLHF